MIPDPDRLFRILSTKRFLSMEGLSGEEAIFIQTYDVADEDRVSAMLKSLAIRLRNFGINVAEVDLFRLFLDKLQEEGVLEGFLRDESTFHRRDLFEGLKNYADPEDRMAPRLLRAMEESGAPVTLLSGAGHIFPFLRAHTLLDSTQKAELKHPAVLFFPGEYIQVPGKGSQLRLFGSMPSDGYYRARNLDHYRL